MEKRSIDLERGTRISTLPPAGASAGENNHSLRRLWGGMSCPQGTESFCCHMQLKGTLREEAESAEDSASDRT